MSDAFICPNCGRETNFPIFHNLNITAEPRFKEEILSHRLFHFGCSCGFETEVVYPMLYHDMERKFMIFMIPDEDERVPEQMRASLMPLAEQGYVFRLVRNVNELCEKILIGDADLDDTAVELLKFVGEVPFKEDHPNLNLSGVYFQQDEQGKNHIVFHTKEEDYALPFDTMQYDIVSEELKKHEEEDVFFPEINRAWAEKILWKK